MSEFDEETNHESGEGEDGGRGGQKQKDSERLLRARLGLSREKKRGKRIRKNWMYTLTIQLAPALTCFFFFRGFCNIFVKIK